MKPSVIIDTNVLLTANDQAEQWVDSPCPHKCRRVLNEIRAKHICVLDRTGEILREYRKRLSISPRDKVAVQFYFYIFQQQHNPERFMQVDIHKHTERGYEEFPDDTALNDFDDDDRKFVAVAIASNKTPLPPILNAADSDWKNHETALQQHEIRVQQLC